MNTPDDWKTTARVTDPERAAFWADIFGVNVVPIKSIIPQRACLPGHPDARVYMLDLRAITPEQRECLVQGLAERFDLDPELVDSKLDREGVPILADQVSVMTTDRAQLAMILDDDEMGDCGDVPMWNCGDCGDTFYEPAQGGLLRDICPSCGSSNIYEQFEDDEC